MVGLVGGVFDGGENILPLKERVVGEDFVHTGPGGKQLEHIGDAHAIAPDARSPAALAFFDCDPLQAIEVHHVLLSSGGPVATRTPDLYRVKEAVQTHFSFTCLSLAAFVATALFGPWGPNGSQTPTTPSS